MDRDWKQNFALQILFVLHENSDAKKNENFIPNNS